MLADYERVFRKLGVDQRSELRLRGRSDADGDDAAELLASATGVFFSGGDQSKLRTLVGSRTNEIISRPPGRGPGGRPAPAPARPRWAAP